MDCDARREVIEGVVRNILASEEFERSKRLRKFLSYIVQECLDGRQDRIKAYSIGLSVFDRPENFDPNLDPLVRIEAGRLRRALERYNYSAHDPIQIEVPKGAYVPTFKTCALGEPLNSGVETDPRPSFVEGARSALSKWGIREMLAASVLTATALLLWGQWNRAAPTSEKPLLAVIPFTMTSGDARAQQIARGVSEEVIGGLAEQREFATLGRAATDMFGKNASGDGQSYNVKYFVEGSVSMSEARGVLAARLVDARGGQVLWSARYNIVPDGDLLAIQSDLGRDIAQQVVGPHGVLETMQRSKSVRPKVLEPSKQQTRVTGLP